MSNPVVTVKNNTSRDIFVDGDPNWDDQELMINDKVITEIYTLTKGVTITVSVNWEGLPGEEGMFGVIFAEAKNYDFAGVGFYQLTVGQDPKTGNLGITDGGPTGGKLDINYTLSDQTPWSMTMDFTDVS
jgi:hypothetical protein